MEVAYLVIYEKMGKSVKLDFKHYDIFPVSQLEDIAITANVFSLFFLTNRVFMVYQCRALTSFSPPPPLVSRRCGPIIITSAKKSYERNTARNQGCHGYLSLPQHTCVLLCYT